MFRSLQRRLAFLVLGLAAFSLLPLTGAVKAQAPPQSRNQFLPYYLPGPGQPQTLQDALTVRGSSNRVGDGQDSRIPGYIFPGVPDPSAVAGGNQFAFRPLNWPPSRHTRNRDVPPGGGFQGGFGGGNF